MVQISLQNSGGKVVFSGGVPWNPSPPWAPTGVKVPWSLNPKRAGLFGPISQPGNSAPPPRSRKPIDETSSVWY